MAIPTLVLGSFNLTDWAGSAYATQVIAEGTSKGSPVPIEVAVKSWLQDGSVVVTQGYDNRTVTLRVKLRGTSLTAVANAEAALFAELGKPNLLTWTPASGPASVFRVVTSSMEHAPSTDEDLAEGLASPWRTYNLRLLCEAFTRSATETVFAALAANGATTTLVNDGSATTGWTGSVSAGSLTGPTVVSGAVKVGTTAALYGAVTVSATLTTTITTSSTKYLVVDWKPEPTTIDGAGASVSPLRAFGDGVELARLAEQPSPTAGYVRSTFQVGAAVSSIAALRLDSASSIPSSAGIDFDGSSASVRSLYVDNINRTDIKPSLGSARQLLQQRTVPGSARTQASLTVEHATSALGDVLVYVYPNTVVGYVPCLRPYRVAGGATTTTDSTLVSGARDAIQGATATFDVPVSQLPQAMATLMARIAPFDIGPQTVTLTWTASTRIGSTAIGSTTTGTQTVIMTGAAYQMLALGRVSLPTVDVSQGTASAVVRITIAATSALAVTLDEAWLFSDIGQLVGPVACGTGTPSAGGPAKRLFLEPPSVNIPRPRLLIGHSADRSDAFFPAGAVSGWGDMPVFDPSRGPVNILTVTSNALDVSVTPRGFAAWHTNAAS